MAGPMKPTDNDEPSHTPANRVTIKDGRPLSCFRLPKGATLVRVRLPEGLLRPEPVVLYQAGKKVLPSN
jgi:hypothetical protein